MKINITSIFFLLFLNFGYAQLKNNASKVWVPDNGDGTYRNPIIHADYSDPDAIRVGDEYYMVSSSFNYIPGLPILYSKDLVNWSLVGHALEKQPPFDHFDKVQNGNGVWAPSIRFHNHEFYIYYPDPDFGIYLVKAKNIRGPWSEPVLVEAGKGLIDPCPLWDDDGKLWLVHAFAGSRAGIKSILVVKQMNTAGTKTISAGVMVYDGHEKDPTIEGPKFYKRNGYYYIFAPAGGVSTGWQLVLRSKNIFGPYERKVVMDQGSSSVNGPHQGAWVNTASGDDWFIHFQDKGAYGRVVQLQPMKWMNDWPVIGIDKDGDGKGEPVESYKKPASAKYYPVISPQESDEFNSPTWQPQWQWQANPGNNWAFTTAGGFLRMFAVFKPDSVSPEESGNLNFWNVPNILTQKFPAEEFKATVLLRFNPLHENDRAGLVITGTDYAFIAVQKKGAAIELVFNECYSADKNGKETTMVADTITGNIFLRVVVSRGAVCRFSYSSDGINFQEIKKEFTAKPGRWVGAKLGLFCTGTVRTNDAGFADIDWFRVEKEP